MRPSRFSDEQITDALAQVAAGTPVVVICRQLGITTTTFYRWRRKFGDAHQTGEARVLREENRKLKQLVAELSLERQFLQESLSRHEARR